MPIDAINKLREAEDAAEKIELNAQKEAKELIDNANYTAKAIISDAENNAKMIMKDTENNVKKYIAELNNNYEFEKNNKIDKLLNKVKNVEEDILNIIIDEFV